MSTWTSGSIETNGVEIFYHRTGGEKPPLILLHGITDNGLCWTRVSEDLEQDYDIIMVDARGHGRSSAPDSGYSPQDHAVDVVGLIEALTLEKPILLGHSMGASVASVVAGKYPHLIGCILLEDPPWGLQSGTLQERQLRMKEWQEELQEHQARSDEALLAFVRERSPGWDESELGPWMDAKRSVSLNVLQMLVADHHWQQTIAKISCPTLLITADPDLGAIVNAETVQNITQINPHIQVVNISGAGHNIRRERYQAYIEAVWKFLKQ